MKNKNKLLIMLGSFTLILVLITGIVLVSEKKSESNNKEEIISSENAYDPDTIIVDGKTYRWNTDIETILFLGVDKDAKIDSKDYAGGNGQSDSVNLLVLNKADKTGQIIQISRNTMVDIELYNLQGEKVDYDRGQLTLQYAYGTSDSNSCRLMLDRVSEILYGIPMRKYLALTIDGIVKTADSLGGVSITIPEDYTMIEPEFKKGATVVLDGELAERYVRYRDLYDLEGNLQRMERQADFVNALLIQLQEERDFNEYLRIYEELEPYMETNMYAEELEELSEYDISTEVIVLPGELTRNDDYAEYHLDNEKVKEIVLKTFYKQE